MEVKISLTPKKTLAVVKTPFSLDLSSGWRGVVSFTPRLIFPGKGPLPPVSWESVWALGPIWTLRLRETSFDLAGDPHPVV